MVTTDDEAVSSNPRPTVDGRGGPADLSETVRALEQQLARRRRTRLLRILTVVVVLLCGGFGIRFYQKANAPAPPDRFKEEAAELRDVLEEVQSTGVVEPLHRVEVGAQVSGRVVRVEVDFNDRVEKGQLLAEIDPELFGADVVQTRAQLKSGQAALGRARAGRDAAAIRLSRLKLLVAEGAASSAELDQAQADADMAEAEVVAAEAESAQIDARLKSANTTLKYTKIYSPIAGVVIDRLVEPGQTVAASFSTPVLFQIARDLTRMRVLAEIDEADVGKVEAGMPTRVVVDAFPDQHFQGELTQIRLSPTTVEGVVTYGAVIVVDNPDGKLRPGMTATATITTARAEKVVAVRNAALRFEPLPASDKKDGGAMETDSAGKEPEPPRLTHGQGRVYRVLSTSTAQDPQLKSQIVDVGVTDGVFTVVRSGLQVGERVVVDERPPGGRGSGPF